MDEEIKDLQGKNNELTHLWEKEKSQRTVLKNLKVEIEDLKVQVDRAQREGHLDKAAELKYLICLKKIKN